MYCGHCCNEPCSCFEVDPVPVSRTKAIDMILNERIRQNSLHGETYSSILQAVCAIGEEHGELSEAIYETLFDQKRPELSGEDNIIKEACQLAAVCVKLIEGILDGNINLQREDSH